MQNPFEILNANRQASIPSRQVILCNYFTPSVNTNAQRLINATANIPAIDQCRVSNTIITTPNAVHPLAGLSVQIVDLLNAFKACYLDQIFDPHVLTYYLTEGFMRSLDNSAQLSQLLSAILLDLIAMSPIFLQGDSYRTSSFRQGRLLLLLYPFLFTEKLPFQQQGVQKTNTNTIGFQLIKKFLSILQTTTVVSKEDIERLAPLQPHFEQITLQQTIGQILETVNKSVLETIAKKQMASNYIEGEGSYISVKVPNSLEYTKLRALGYNIIIKVSGSSYIPVFIRSQGIMSLMLPQDSSPSIRLFLQNLPALYRRYPSFFVRTQGLLTTLLDNLPAGEGNLVRNPQVDQNLYATVGLHLIFKTLYKKVKFTPFNYQKNQQTRIRDPEQDGLRILNLPNPQANVQQIIVRASQCVTEPETHQVIDGTGQFITDLTLKSQREYISNYLLNAPPQLEMKLN